MRYETESKQYNDQLYKLYQLGYHNVTTDVGLDWNAEVVLGKGSFGKVILARRRWGDPKILVSVKIMEMVYEKDGQTPMIEEKRVWFKDIVGNEIRNHTHMTDLKNPNIVQQLAHFIIDHKMFIILEYCNSQTVFAYVTSRKIFPEQFRLNERQLRFWFRQMVNGLHAMHSADIIHRDFKCENVLVHRNPMTGSSRLKICDFGMTCKNHLLNRVIGTPAYVSPQALQAKLTQLQNPDSDPRYHGKPNDIWSLGCALYEMRYRRIPFPSVGWRTEDILEASIQSIADNLQENPLDFFPGVSTGLSHLLSGMMSMNSAIRLTTEQIQQDRWFTHHSVQEPTEEYFSQKFPQEYTHD